MIYYNSVIKICNKIEGFETIIERGRFVDCWKTGNFNHGLNRLGKWGFLGGSVRILFGTTQIIGGLCLSILFGLGALLSNHEGQWHNGHKMLCERSWKQIGHGICNVVRGFGELIPGVSWVLFSRTGHDNLPDDPWSLGYKRCTYTYEDIKDRVLEPNFYFIYARA
ncbi:MAG: hypothetical protein LLG04_07200 [Parachlamydia sp.]|nr:hypothetical protein [Parachlamydia sp.]